MSTEQRALLDAVLRNDLTAFIQRSFQTVVPGQRGPGRPLISEETQNLILHMATVNLW